MRRLIMHRFAPMGLGTWLVWSQRGYATLAVLCSDNPADRPVHTLTLAARPGSSRR